MRIFIWFMLVSTAFGQLSFDDLAAKVKAGVPESELVPLVQEQGISFPVNLKHLKKMKKAGFPDYIIDECVVAFGPQRPERANYGSSVSNAPVYSSYWYNNWYLWDYWFVYSDLYRWWSPYMGLAYSSFFWDSYGPYGYWWWHDVAGVYRPGNRLTPYGYVNLYEDRERGRAVHRSGGQTKATGSRRTQGTRRAVSSTRSSTRSSSGSSSRSSSSGSRAVRR